MKGLISTVVAISAGTLVLLGYFLPIAILQSIRDYLLQSAILVAGVGVLVGVSSLAGVHFAKIRDREKGMFYSLILLFFLAISLVLGLFFGPSNPVSLMLFDAIQLPVEASLMALLAVTLLYASVRLLRWRADFTGIVFIVTALLILAGAAPVPFFGTMPFLSDLRSPIQILSTAGARGILIGVALGTLTTGLRILLGADRPYGGK